MKTSSLLLACFATATVVVATSNSPDGFLWTIDQTVESGSSAASIDADTASAIVARRRGLTGSRLLGTTDAAKLQEIDYYGGWQQPLQAPGLLQPPSQGQNKAKDDTAGPGRLFIRIHGYDGGFDGLDRAPLPDLWIEKPTTALKTDFGARERSRNALCEYAVPPSKNHARSKGVEIVFTYPAEKDIGCLAASQIPNIPLILTLYSVVPETAASVSDTIGPLVRILKHLSATQGVESTVLLLPSKLAPAKAKHSSELKKRSSETPLDLSIHSTASSPKASSVAAAAAAAGLASNYALPSVIPQCFSSQAACTNTTNACSGHGECYAASTSCFKCRCSATVEHEYEDGSRKTISWGGNACEKQDVSVPFIIFASFGVAFTTLIVGGIALLFSMGSQALPSVLSAGVAGPTARR